MRARPDEPLADWCELQLDGCTGRATEHHHKRPRSAGGGDEKANTIDLDGHCHRFIHANPARSYDEGWLLRRTA